MTKTRFSPSALAGIRIALLAAGLAVLHLGVVRPLWGRADTAAARKNSRLQDCETIDSGWSSLADRVARATGTTPVADSTVAAWLTGRENPGAADLPALASTTPVFLQEIGRLAGAYDLTWPVIEAGRPEAAGMALSSGETVPLGRVPVTLTGRGAYASVARAVGELERSSLPLVVRDLKLKASPGGLIEADLVVDLYGAP